MKVGEYITCKNNFYKSNGITHVGFTENVVQYFQKPIYKKGQKYKIIDIGVTSKRTLFHCYNPNEETKPLYTLEGKFDPPFKFSPPFIWDVFYSRKEERNIKLKKLKNL